MTFQDKDSERLLLLRLQQGDRKAFAEIYNQYQRLIAGNLLRLLKSEELAEDVMHDLFLKIWDNRHQIDPAKSFRAYLIRIAENLVYDVFRKAALDKKLQSQLLSASPLFYSHVEEDRLSIENREALHRAIDQLSPESRQVFVLCKLEEKSYKEVSDLLGISTATINYHLTKANRLLKQQLSPASLIAASIIVSEVIYRV